MATSMLFIVVWDTPGGTKSSYIITMSNIHYITPYIPTSHFAVALEPWIAFEEQCHISYILTGNSAWVNEGHMITGKTLEKITIIQEPALARFL